MNQKHKRTIKFRAWCPSRLKMIYDYEMPPHESFNLKPGDSIHNLIWRIGNDNETLMQHTGLKDKNGVEIYEGDIIVWSGTLDDCIFNHVCEVIFDLYQWCGCAIYSPQQKSTIPFGEHGCNPNEVNVVGNVYENKELLYLLDKQ